MYGFSCPGKEVGTTGKIVSSAFISLGGVISHMDRWHFGFASARIRRLWLWLAGRVRGRDHARAVRRCI